MQQEDRLLRYDVDFIFTWRSLKLSDENYIIDIEQLDRIYEGQFDVFNKSLI